MVMMMMMHQDIHGIVTPWLCNFAVMYTTYLLFSWPFSLAHQELANTACAFAKSLVGKETATPGLEEFV
jgi:hypothetical protein